MSPTLPKHPNLDHLKKSAKQLLAAQRDGDAGCCQFLRRLRRFSDASDSDILAARVTLKDTQYLVALFYGFESWDKLRRYVQAPKTTNANSIEAVVLRSRVEIPEYAGPGVPLAITAALNHAGVEIEFMEFAAASGWAFSFAYHYADASPAHMAVRGNPAADGPLEVFAALPDQLGFGYDHAPTAGHDALWRFAKEHVDAGTPIMSEHLDGGLITGYRDDGGDRRLYFDGTVGAGWLGVGDLQPHAVYVFERQRGPLPRETITRQALRRAVEKGSPHVWREIPQGLAGLRAYLADVGDLEKDFAETEEWFCWAAFERLMARRCCELWLRSVAEQFTGRASDLLSGAAERYGKAFELYDAYRLEVRGGEPTPPSLHDRVRASRRIAVIEPLLAKGIAAEAEGLEVLKCAVETIFACS